MSDTAEQEPPDPGAFFHWAIDGVPSNIWTLTTIHTAEDDAAAQALVDWLAHKCPISEVSFLDDNDEPYAAVKFEAGHTRIVALVSTVVGRTIARSTITTEDAA